MSFALVDIALRAASIALLLVLAASLLRDVRQSVAGRLAIAFALGSAAHAATVGIGVAPAISIWHAPLIAFSTGNIVVFWLFTRALFDDSFRLRLWHGVIWLAVVAFSFVNCAVLAPAGGGRLGLIVVNLLVLRFIALDVVLAVASWSADLVEDCRRVRVFIVVAAALYGGFNAILHLMIADGNAADIDNAANGALLACVVAAISMAMLRVGGAELFAAATAATEAPAQPD